ncbi:reverse transcriptase domain-containing protein [Tanacetum coccineum]
MEEVKYGEFGRPTPFSRGNGAKYHVGPPGYYTRVNNRPPFGEKIPSLEELLNKHLEESIRRRAEMEEWVKKPQENMEINKRKQSASLKNMETQIKQLTKEFHAKAANEVPNSTVGQCKAVYANDEAAIDNTSSKETNKLHKVSFISNDDVQLNLGSFTLPCTVGSLNFYVMADLGASVNVIPKSMFEHLRLANLKKTDMLIETADMTKRAPIGIMENILVKIDKFLFPSHFVVIDMLKTHNETMILGRSFLATIHAEIDIFNKGISLGIMDDRVTLDMDKKIHNFMTLVGKVYMVNLIHNNKPPNLLYISSNTPSYESPQFEKSKNLHHQNNNGNYMQERSSKKARMVKLDTQNVHFCKPVKQDYNGILKVWPIWDPVMKLCNGGMRKGVVKVLFQVPQLRSLLWSKKIADLDLGTTPSRNGW